MGCGGSKDECAGGKALKLPPVLTRQGGAEVRVEELAGKKVGLYFSAHWCPPCRKFTPVLKEFYEKYRKERDDFEVIFVSKDKDEEAMNDYFINAHGGYLVAPYKSKECQVIHDQQQIAGIPTLIIFDYDTGAVVTKDGRGAVAGRGAQSVLEKGWVA